MTPKQQRFVEEYLIDLNATAAYQRAGYTAKNPNVAGVEAHKLLKNPKIAVAVEEARQKHAKAIGVTLESVTAEFVQDRSSAREAGNFNAAIKATEHIAKMHGVYVEKRENTNVTKIQDMSEEELERLRDSIAAQGGVDQGDRAATAPSLH